MQCTVSNQLQRFKLQDCLFLQKSREATSVMQHWGWLSSTPHTDTVVCAAPPPCPGSLIGLLTSKVIMIFQTLFEYMDFTGWLLFGFVLLLLIDVVRNWRPSNFPPGPWAVPFLGNIFTGVDFKTMDKVKWTIKFLQYVYVSVHLYLAVWFI